MNRLQLSDADPSRGLQLRLATTWYGEQRFAARCAELRVLKLVSKASFQRYQGEAQSLECVLLEDLASKLRSGQLYATGLRVGEYTSVTIPREWWAVATLNEETNTAEGNGVTFSGLLVFETTPENVVQAKLARSLAGASVPLATKRGRPGKHDWHRLMADLAVRLSEHGVPAEGEKAELERWAASVMLTDPAESEIRIYVTKAIEAHRKSIG